MTGSRSYYLAVLAVNFCRLIIPVPYCPGTGQFVGVNPVPFTLQPGCCCRPPASESLEGKPSMKEMLIISNFLQNQSSVSRSTDTLSVGCCFDPAKGLSCTDEEELSKSGMWVHPI